MGFIKENIIEIAIASDSNYLIPATVLLKSLFDNNKNVQLSINLIYLVSSTNEEDLSFWEKYTESYGHLFRRIPVKDEQLSVYPELRHTKSTYLRLLLPEILPQDIIKILYLDSDIIVLDNLIDLYQLDITEYYAAAVKEVINVYAEKNDYLKSHLESLRFTSKEYYFGAGVMLMNIRKMRDDSVISKYFDFAIKYPELIIWSDQDIVNPILKSAIKYIPPKYNMNYYVERDVLEKLWNKREVNEAFSSPAIIHFIGPVKPWNFFSFHPKTKMWWYYLKQTPFKDFQPQNKSIRNLPQKYYLKFSRMIDRKLTLSQKQKLGKYVPIFLKNKFKKSIIK
jgi:lipopolysaccharide biosynthesis glycosyltransferase